MLIKAQDQLYYYYYYRYYYHYSHQTTHGKEIFIQNVVLGPPGSNSPPLWAICFIYFTVFTFK
jgi:hypothetical protein